MTASLIATATLLACLSEIETGHDDRKIGLAGEVSRYQIRPEIWRAYCHPWKNGWLCPDTSRDVARRIQTDRVNGFYAIHGRGPTVREWYVLWNAPAQAYRGKLSKVVAKRAERFENLVLASVGRPAASGVSAPGSGRRLKS